MELYQTSKYKALEMTANGTLVLGLHNKEPTKLPPVVINRIGGMVPNQVRIKTFDHRLI